MNVLVFTPVVPVPPVKVGGFMMFVVVVVVKAVGGSW
jgi:hypothetical protein